MGSCSQEKLLQYLWEEHQIGGIAGCGAQTARAQDKTGMEQWCSALHAEGNPPDFGQVLGYDGTFLPRSVSCGELAPCVCEDKTTRAQAPCEDHVKWLLRADPTVDRKTACARVMGECPACTLCLPYSLCPFPRE